MNEQDHLNLKPCPFCNVLGSPALGRVVCWECGNAGPSDDPTGAKWNSLAADVTRGKAADDLIFAAQNFFDAYGVESATGDYLTTWRNKCCDALRVIKELAP